MHGQRSSHHALLLRSRLRERCLQFGLLLGLPVLTFVVVVSLPVVTSKAISIAIAAASLRLCLVFVTMMHAPMRRRLWRRPMAVQHVVGCGVQLI